MNRFFPLGILSLCISALLLVNCSSNKSSDEACRFQTTMDLDHGNYDAVLASPCANDMQKGAAYFGKAGFDVKEVINNFSISSTSTSTQSDLSVYMTTLVTSATETTYNYLDDAIVSYLSITTASGNYTVDNYKDAQFYISLVEAVKGLTLINLVIPNILAPDGTLNTACDNNHNGVPDDADATACALVVASSISLGTSTVCSNATYSRSPDIQLLSSAGTPTPSIYSGLTITVTPVSGGTTTGCTPSGNTAYKRLLYQEVLDTSHYWSATTTSDLCAFNDGNQWPCPIVQDGLPLDLVTAIGDSLDSAIASMVSSGTGTTDVQTAIQDIKDQACPTGTCTSSDIANYIQTNLN